MNIDFRSLNTAVLFLVFNRPETTAQVFEAIRRAKPPRLYVAADGPRTNREGEAERVARVREIATAVDWPCAVKKLFRDENLGCKYAVSSAITWFFEREEQGIILEDDCLPHSDFFYYCQWALGEFKNVPEVWHINGNNFGADVKLFKGDLIGFSSLPQAWGWASWSNRWRHYQENPFYLGEGISARAPGWLLSLPARTIKLAHIASLQNGLDTWDYQWQVVVLNANGLTVCPSSNLVSNLGNGPDATHTKHDPERIRLPRASLKNFEYSTVKHNSALTTWYENKMGLRGIRRYFQVIFSANGWLLKRKIHSWISRLLFSGQKPIVVASTGRSGSTMLARALAESFVISKYPRLPKSLIKLLVSYSQQYVVRLNQIGQKTAPVLKTHDVYDGYYKVDARYIFVYGDPLDSALSVNSMGEQMGRHWIEHHIFNLCGKGSALDLFDRDVLNYEQQISSWRSAPGVLPIKYDDLWDRVDEIEKFFGHPVSLPNRQPRQEKQLPRSYDIEMFDRLRRLYADVR